MDPALIFGQRAGRDPVVELVGVQEPLAERVLEGRSERHARRPGGQAKADHLASAGRHVDDVAGRRLGAGLRRVHGALLACDHEAVERVLHVRRRIGRAPQPCGVRVVLGEQQLRGAVARQGVVAKLGMEGRHRSAGFAQERFRVLVSPRPGVPEPQRRQEVQPGGLGAPVVDRHPDQDVVRTRLGVFHEHVEVAVVVEDPRVDQLVLEVLPRAPPIRLHEVTVGELPLRVLVEVLHVRVGRRRVDVEVVLLDVLAVVPLAVGEAEHPLLQDGVTPVPEGEGETEALAVVGDPGDAVLAPPVGPGTGLVVREVVPGVAVLAVVLADRPPLPLAQVRAPLLPRNAGLAGVVQALLLCAVVER